MPVNGGVQAGNARPDGRAATRCVLEVWADGGMYVASCRACDMRCRARGRDVDAAVHALPCPGPRSIDRTLRAAEEAAETEGGTR